jgi:hypothetical protein
MEVLLPRPILSSGKKVTNRSRMARAAFKPTEKQRGIVAGMSATGTPQDVIASKLGISKPTLAKHFPEELADSKALRVHEAGSLLFKIVMKLDDGHKPSMPEISALIYYLKSQGGANWRDNHTTVEHTGADGAALPGAGGQVNIYLPDNQRDPALARPMKTIEHQPLVAISG